MYPVPNAVRIVANDFEGNEPLRQEVVNTFPKYGNGDPGVDGLARRVADIAFDALEHADNPDGILLFPALYSLYHHYKGMKDIPATPDGRRRGEPISENQSAVYGADSGGLSAMLRSAAPRWAD